MAVLIRQRLRPSRGAALVLFGWAALVAILMTATAAQPAVTPQDVHAAFTVNLTRFISWPASAFSSPTAPLVIGTFPRDPINEELDAAIRGETHQGRPIQTLRIRSLDDVMKCHVVFMSRNVVRQPVVLERCARRPILTISNAEGFLELGGHVRFDSGPSRTKLHISVANLRASGLEARSQLLRLAAAP